MNLNVPKSGTLDIKTKLELADYAANLRQEWEEEKAKLKPKGNAKLKFYSKHKRPDPKWGKENCG